MAELHRPGFLGLIDGVKGFAEDLTEVVRPLSTLGSNLSAFHRGAIGVSTTLISGNASVFFLEQQGFSHPWAVAGGVAMGAFSMTAIGSGAVKQGLQFVRTLDAPWRMRGKEARGDTPRKLANYGMHNAGSGASGYNSGVQARLAGRPASDIHHPSAKEGWDEAQRVQYDLGQPALKIFATTCQSTLDARQSEANNDPNVSPPDLTDSLTAAPNAPPLPRDASVDDNVEPAVKTDDGKIPETAVRTANVESLGKNDLAVVPHPDAPSVSEESELASADAATMDTELGASDVEASGVATDVEAAETTDPTSVVNQTEMSELPADPKATDSEDTKADVKGDSPAAQDPQLVETQMASGDNDPAVDSVDADEAYVESVDAEGSDARSISAAEPAPESTETTTEVAVSDGEGPELDPAETIDLGDTTKEASSSSPPDLESLVQDPDAGPDESNNFEVEAKPGASVGDAQGTVITDPGQEAATPEAAPELEAAPAPVAEPAPEAAAAPEAEPEPEPEPDTDDPEPSM